MTDDCARSRRPVSRLASVLAAALAGCLLAGLLVPAPVAAGDNAAMFYFEPKEVDVESGETVTIDLVASSHGAYGDGVGELSATIAYDPDVFTVTDVEQGSMLAGGGEDGNGSATVDGTVEIDDENGVITVDQERIPPGNGTMGTGTTVTLTLAISEDAPTTNETLEITDGSATFPSDYSVDPIQRDATVLVDGTAADDAAADDGGSGLEDPVPGLTPLSGLAAIGAALWLRARRAR